jgi:hypothetical protein
MSQFWTPMQSMSLSWPSIQYMSSSSSWHGLGGKAGGVGLQDLDGILSVQDVWVLLFISFATQR